MRRRRIWPTPLGSYLGNYWQEVTDDDAHAMAAALNLAVAARNAGSLLTDEQATAESTRCGQERNPLIELNWTEQQRTALLRMYNEYVAELRLVVITAKNKPSALRPFRG